MYCRTTIIGRLMGEWTHTKTPTGYDVYENTIAFKNMMSKDRNSSFIRLKCWGKTGELAQQYTKSGSKLLAEGDLVTKFHEKDGHKQLYIHLNVNNVVFLDEKGKSSTNDKIKPANEFAKIDQQFSNEESNPFYFEDEAEDEDAPF